jgi:hypothetical protein
VAGVEHKMPTDMDALTETLQRMKIVYENAIRKGKYTELIRSKRLIETLHEFAVKELKKRIPPQWIYTDKPLYGYPKTKTQDILIQPQQDSGKNLSVGPLMSINVRSQLSSIDKNYDTLFERLFAEALNLHNRFPYLVLGYIYLLPKTGYDDKAAKEKLVKFTERYNIEKYILSFLSIADREDPEDVPWKYERICLLIVDFERTRPSVMDNLQVFSTQGLVSKKFADFFSFETLSVKNFFDDLHKIMMERYYLLLQS